MNCMTMEKSDILENYLKKNFQFKNISYFNNGTDAIEGLLKHLNLKEKSEIIVPVTLCNSVIESIIKNGLKPVFIDINENFTVDKEEIISKITDKTNAIIYVEQYGIKCKTWTFYNNGKKIINILDACQGTLRQKDSNVDYVFYSFSKNKPYSLGKYAILEGINISSMIIPVSYQKELIKLFQEYDFDEKIKLQEYLEKELGCFGTFIKAKRTSFHRIIFILNIKNFEIFEDHLYTFLEANNIDVVQTTIDISPFQIYSNNIIDDFPNFKCLKNQALFFRTNRSFICYKKVIQFIRKELSTNEATYKCS